MLRLIRRRVLTRRKIILLAVLYVFAVYFVAVFLAGIIDKFDTKKHGVPGHKHQYMHRHEEADLGSYDFIDDDDSDYET